MPASRRSELHHRSADDLSRSQPLDVLGHLIERENVHCVANLVLGSQRHDLAQIRVVAPERAVQSLFTRNPRKQRDVDAIADQSHIAIVAAGREQAESQLYHLRRTRAVDDGIEVTLSRRLAELLAKIGPGFALDVDDVIDPVVLRDGELVGVAGESDDRRPAAKELRVLNGIYAQSPNTAIRAERAGIAEFLDAAVRRHTCIGERGELLELQPLVHLDHVASRDGYELRESAI